MGGGLAGAPLAGAVAAAGGIGFVGHLDPKPLAAELEPLMRRAPGAAVIAARQRPWWPLLTPLPAHQGMRAERIEATALYAGEVVRDIDRLESAADVVAMLTPQAAR